MAIPEIEYLGVPTVGDEDVCRLDVPGEALPRNELHRVHRQFPAPRLITVSMSSGPSAILLFHGHAFKKLHGYEGIISGMIPNLVNGANVGMAQGRCRLSFTAQPSLRLQIVALDGYEFQSDESTQFQILCLVDNAHAAGCNQLSDFEAARGEKFTGS